MVATPPHDAVLVIIMTTKDIELSKASDDRRSVVLHVVEVANETLLFKFTPTNLAPAGLYLVNV